VHRRCSGVNGALNKVAAFYVCDICAGQKNNKTITQYMDLGSDIKLEKVKVSTFTYLGDKIQANGGAHEAVRSRIKTAWSKWREVASLLLKKELAIKNRALVYKIYVRSALIYGSETWALTVTDKTALNRTEMRMLRWMMGGGGFEKSEEYVRGITGVESIVEVAKSHRLKWFGHVHRMEDGCWIKKCMSLEVDGERKRGRPAKRWMDLIKEDLREKGLRMDEAKNRVQWRAAIRAKRLNPGKLGKNSR